MALTSPHVGSRVIKGAPLALLWLAAASVTVSFVGAELYEMFSARDKAEARFEAEQSALRKRGRELQQALTAASTVAAQYARHAQEMADREEKFGGSCMAGRGPGPGEIRAFRRMDAIAARGLAEQIAPEVSAATAVLNAADGLRFASDVPALRSAMVRAVDGLNAMRGAPLWSQVLAFAEAQQAAASNILIAGVAWRCDDAARGLMLTQLQRVAHTVGKLTALAAPALLDHANSREIAQATLIRTWAGALNLLPRQFWGGKPVLDGELRARYGLDEAPAVLGANNLPLMLAWLLEIILIALLMLASPDHRLQVGPDRAQRVGYWLGVRLRTRPGLIGELANALTGQPVPALAVRAPYVDRNQLFADDAMEERASTVAPWYRPWGSRDIVAVPMVCYPAVRAARELWRTGLLRRLASGIGTAELMRDRRLASVMRAVCEPVPDTVWEVYQVTDDQLTRWLLSQPLEARAVLGLSS